jgi:apolipoprotein N-acyltransferase
LGSQSIIDQQREVYNSTFLFSPEGKVEARYNKNRLVLFGESIPFNTLINKLTGNSLFSIMGGKKRSRFTTSFASWRNLICSEVFYPLSDSEIQNIDFIVNQSNEAWFKSGLPKQMWSAAIFRAVENRRSLVKTGNYSYSGVISPTGKTLIKKPVNSNKSIIVEVPYSSKSTIFNSSYHLTGHLSVFILFSMLSLSFFFNFEKVR